MLATSSQDGNNHPEDDHVAKAIDVHTAFLHADIDQDLYAETARGVRIERGRSVETSQSSVRILESTRTVPSTCGDNFGTSEFPLTLDRPELLQKRCLVHHHFHPC